MKGICGRLAARTADLLIHWPKPTLQPTNPNPSNPALDLLNPKPLFTLLLINLCVGYDPPALPPRTASLQCWNTRVPEGRTGESPLGDGAEVWSTTGVGYKPPVNKVD